MGQGTVVGTNLRSVPGRRAGRNEMDTLCLINHRVSQCPHGGTEKQRVCSGNRDNESLGHPWMILFGPANRSNLEAVRAGGWGQVP
jgi:hypothetical protein